MQFTIFTLGLAAFSAVSALPAAQPELVERSSGITCKTTCSVVATQAYHFYCGEGVGGKAIITTQEKNLGACALACSDSGVYCTAANYVPATKQCTLFSSNGAPVKIKGTSLAVAVTSC